MTFLAPAALWTLAALALPLAIHLWRRPPRTVRLGSLRFLQSRSRRWQNLRWREYALLFARLALLAALALLLARPCWRRPPLDRPARWALVDPAAAPEGSSRERLRALQSTGVETRLLAPGFPAVSALPIKGSAPAPDLWSLLREADAALPAGSSLAVFSPDRLASLHGIRPALVNVRTEWIDTPVAPTSPDASAARPPAGHPLTVLVLHDADRAGDARCVAAAWRAIAQADQRPLTVSVSLTTDPVAAAADWIVWLSSQPVPPAIAARAANLLEDAARPAADTPPGWIVSPLPPVRLWRRGPPAAGSVIWTDGFGQPLLTRTHDAHGARWHFASRFDPAWNDLPLGAALPAALRTLLTVEPVAGPDPRLADPSQLPPSDAPAATPTRIVLPGAEIDLRPPLWLLAALFFCLERLLSHRRAPRPAPAAVDAPEPVLTR